MTTQLALFTSPSTPLQQAQAIIADAGRTTQEQYPALEQAHGVRPGVVSMLYRWYCVEFEARETTVERDVPFIIVPPPAMRVCV